MKTILCLIAFAVISVSAAHAQFGGGMGGMHFSPPPAPMHTNPAPMHHHTPSMTNGMVNMPIKGHGKTHHSANTQAMQNNSSANDLPPAGHKKKKKKKGQDDDSASGSGN